MISVIRRLQTKDLSAYLLHPLHEPVTYQVVRMDYKESFFALGMLFVFAGTSKLSYL